MKTLIGFALIIAGIAFGIYAGVWWAFIGGIIDVIEAIRATNLVAMDVAIGVAKVMFSGAIGYLACALLVIPGYAMTH